MTWRRIVKAKKNPAGKEVLEKLDSYLNAASPEPVYFLTRLWDDQQRAVTYKQLREAILNGYMDEKELQAWQQDYAGFTNEHLKPIWTDAMQAAAAEITAKHPDYYFDPLAGGIHQWTEDHGAQWVSTLSDEQREAVRAMIDHAAASGLSADELSRAIRPCIGLNQKQAKANLRYYEHIRTSLLEQNPTMKEATAAKRAREAAAKYAARQHRQRAFDIATTELAFAYNKGADEGVRQAQEQHLMGKMVKVWSTSSDEGVCAICGALDGVEIGMDDDFNYPGHTLYNGQKQTAPAHPRCRCAIVYREVEPPDIPAEPAEAIPDWYDADMMPASETPDASSPATPPPMAMPADLQLQSEAHLGETGKMYLYTDGDGRQWLFKPAQSKGGTPEAFRAYAQQAGYQVQYIMDPGTAVPILTGELGGQFGTLQQRIDTMEDAFGYKAWQHTGGPLPEGAVQQLQREHVTDWLLGNFDSHGGNFVTDSAGRLVGIDKEQSFKYITKKGAQQMSYAFHPNNVYDETEPIYNSLFRRFAKGEIDLNLQDSLTYIKRVEAISDTEYREIFRGYAEALKGKGKAAEELLDQITERKATLRDTYRTFYSDLLTQRTGKKQIFRFADETPEHLKQPLAAVAHTPELLQKMPLAELKQMAKQKQIPYFHNMSKAQLVTSISDPTQVSVMSAQVRDRLAANEAARRAKKLTAVVPPAKPKESLTAAELFSDLSVVAPKRMGVPVHSDKGSVEGLTLTARRMNIDGQDTFEIAGKLSESVWSSTWNRLKEIGTKGDLIFEVSDPEKALFSKKPKMYLGADLRCRELVVGSGEDTVTFQMYVHGSQHYRAWMGYFRVRTPAGTSGTADAQRVQKVLQQLGLDDLLVNPDSEAEDLMKNMRLVWQQAPARVPELAGLTGNNLRVKLSKILAQEKIDYKRIRRMKWKKVAPGYSTYVEEGVASEYEKAGLRYIWSGVSKADSVVDILKGPGLLSNNSRIRAGIKASGASPLEDMATGGSDNVFTRIGVKLQEPCKYDSCYCGGPYRIIIDAREMERTDWYAHGEDSYGSTEEKTMARRLPAVDFIRRMTDQYRVGNEIMFRHGILKESFTGIACESESRRRTLLDKLQEAKIENINGIPIEKFVKVGKTI